VSRGRLALRRVRGRPRGGRRWVLITLTLAHTLDSLVRVTRRDDWIHTSYRLSSSEVRVGLAPSSAHFGPQSTRSERRASLGTLRSKRGSLATRSPLPRSRPDPKKGVNPPPNRIEAREGGRGCEARSSRSEVPPLVPPSQRGERVEVVRPWRPSEKRVSVGSLILAFNLLSSVEAPTVLWLEASRLPPPLSGP
jgi:hypothetical protein